jgi:hypothetical protein
MRKTIPVLFISLFTPISAMAAGTVSNSSNVNVLPGATATVSVSCPSGLAAGGGIILSNPTFAVSKNARNGNGWQVVARNTGSTTENVTVTVNCLTGAPAGAYVTSIQGNVVNVGAGSNATSTATCSTGKLLSGGYTTAISGSSVMRIYNDSRTTTTGNTWQVSAQNTTGATKSVTAFAYCLQGVNVSITQKVSSGIDVSGYAGVSCDYTTELLMGGGYVFPRLTGYTVYSDHSEKNTAWFVAMSPAPANGDANAKAYAECITVY